MRFLGIKMERHTDPFLFFGVLWGGLALLVNYLVLPRFSGVPTKYMTTEVVTLVFALACQICFLVYIVPVGHEKIQAWKSRRRERRAFSYYIRGRDLL